MPAGNLNKKPQFKEEDYIFLYTKSRRALAKRAAHFCSGVPYENIQRITYFTKKQNAAESVIEEILNRIDLPTENWSGR